MVKKNGENNRMRIGKEKKGRMEGQFQFNVK
jgi:hypothetical protein